MGETKTGGGARQPLDGGGSHLDQKGRARDEWVRSYQKSGGIQAAHKMMNVSLEEARRVIEGAEEKAVKIGQPSNIAVVDAGAKLGGV